MEQDQGAVLVEPKAPSRLRRLLRRLAIGALAILAVIVGGFALLLYSAFTSTPRVPQQTAPVVRLEEMQWKAKGGGGLMEVTFKLINDNSFPVKDIRVACATYGQSGTVISTNVKTVYQVVPPLSMVTVRDLSMGFIDRQSESAGCRVIDLTKSN